MSAQRLKTKKVEWRITDTDPDHLDYLAPITLSARSGAMIMHEYLTPDQARELALALGAGAVRAEG